MVGCCDCGGKLRIKNRYEKVWICEDCGNEYSGEADYEMEGDPNGFD